MFAQNKGQVPSNIPWSTNTAKTHHRHTDILEDVVNPFFLIKLKKKNKMRDFSKAIRI